MMGILLYNQKLRHFITAPDICHLLQIANDLEQLLLEIETEHPVGCLLR